MKTKLQFAVMLGLQAALTGAMAQTQITPAASTGGAGAPPAAASSQSDIEKFIAKTKNPAPWISFGADYRTRLEYMENTFMALSPPAPVNSVGVPFVYSQFRNRVRVWSNIKPVENFDIGIRLDWENRYVAAPSGPMPGASTFSSGAPVYSYTLSDGRHWSDVDGARRPYVTTVKSYLWDEVIIDNLYLRLTNVFDAPLQMTVGRQDIFFGNGWIIGDGTPRDGSRTYFLDAARLQLDVKDIDTVFNLIYVDQGANTTRWLPPINQTITRRWLTEQDERGVILYAINKSIKNLTLEPYFIWKSDDRVLSGGTEGDLYTFGFRGVADLSANWRLRTEVAPQFGTKSPAAKPGSTDGLQKQRVEAFGWNNQLAYFFKDQHNNNLRLGYEYLSGNDPNSTGTYERFDMLWGRWPQWSELLVYNYSTGPRPVEWGNLHRLNLGYSISPSKKTTLNVDYHALWAAEHEPSVYAPGYAAYSPGGLFRGHLLTSKFEFTITKHMKGHLLAEFYWPGDYYDNSVANTKMEMFLRPELYFTW